MQGQDIQCPENGRAYIYNTQTIDPEQPDFFAPNLLGARIQWEVDMSSFDCGCFNTFYTVSMPGKTSYGDLDLQDGYFYCDANAGNFGGQFCPELDLMEANKYAFQTTAHLCDNYSDVGHYFTCDGEGSSINTIDQLGHGGYGPNSHDTIDTTKTFSVQVDLEEKDGMLSGITTELRQGDKKTTMHNYDSTYLSHMTDALKNGQVFVASNWSGDDSWLRKDTCTGTCSSNPLQNIKNISISNINAPKYNPSDYEFSDACADPTDGYCGEQNCPTSGNHCRWSWPKGSKERFTDPDANCRCNVSVE